MRILIGKVDRPKDPSRYTFPSGTYYRWSQNFICICKNCDTALYGTFSYYSSSGLKKPQRFHSSSEKDYNKALKMFQSDVDAVKRTEKYALEAYSCAANTKNCPICGALLNKNLFQSFGAYDFTEKDYTENYKKLKNKQKSYDHEQAKRAVSEYSKKCNLPVTGVHTEKIELIKADTENLTRYILLLIHLENNIYSLEKRLTTLYSRRLSNDRENVFIAHVPDENLLNELEELREKYKKAQNALYNLSDNYVPPNISVKKPPRPKKPVLATPGLFNKKKVLAENEALTAKYQAELAEYQRKVKECDEEKARLIAEDRMKVFSAAQAKVDAKKVALDAAERRYEEKMQTLKALPAPATAATGLLDKEIAEAEDLLQKTYATRNELYAYNIIYEKYRNVIALSTFYEYLTSGRCSSLVGADGAYNIYEGEIRADRIISQLDNVISSLEKIKQNQYMLYSELRSINATLSSMDKTMNKALVSIRNTEEHMKHVSENSDVIAYNTAATAFYTKKNAELTDALGYMVAFN